jgi:hypothetical protein
MLAHVDKCTSVALMPRRPTCCFQSMSAATRPGPSCRFGKKASTNGGSRKSAVHVWGGHSCPLPLTLLLFSMLRGERERHDSVVPTGPDLLQIRARLRQL